MVLRTSLLHTEPGNRVCGAGGKPVSEADFWQQLQQKGMGK
jgi:hypothetical protein